MARREDTEGPSKGAAESARRPFRFGVLVHRWSKRQKWITKARQIEALGYSTFLLPDHLEDSPSSYTSMKGLLPTRITPRFLRAALPGARVVSAFRGPSPLAGSPPAASLPFGAWRRMLPRRLLVQASSLRCRRRG